MHPEASNEKKKRQSPRFLFSNYFMASAFTLFGKNFKTTSLHLRQVSAMLFLMAFVEEYLYHRRTFSYFPHIARTLITVSRAVFQLRMNALFALLN